MRLTNTDGTYFELRIMDYEFPELHDVEYDSNWLLIKIKVKHSQGEGEVVEPCLLTYEVAKIADWLEAIDQDKIQTTKVHFLEPNLLLKLIKNKEGKKYIQIYLGSKSLPAWAKKGLWLDIDIEHNDLRKAIEDLRSQLSRYPRRARC